MKLFADHNIYATTVRFLRDLGHDVVTASERTMSAARDPDLLLAAAADGRVFVTRDRDFGGLVFLQALGAGVVYLRMPPSALGAVHAELARVLGLYGPAELSGAFVVVEPGRHRVRRPAVPPDDSGF